MDNKQRKIIYSLDLGPVKKSLCAPKKTAGLGWTKDKADRVEMGYKAFLFVCWKYKKESQIPTVDIDHFWHYHILHTKKYMKDCKKIFGKYLHHNPF